MILLQETGFAAHLEVTQDLPDIVRDICGIMGGTSQNHQGGAGQKDTTIGGESQTMNGRRGGKNN